MLIVKWLVVVVLLLIVVAIAAGQLGLLQGTTPTDLGVRDGKLKPPSMTENSVTSQAALYPDHPQPKYADIAPLALEATVRPRWPKSRPSLRKWTALR